MRRRWLDRIGADLRWPGAMTGPSASIGGDLGRCRTTAAPFFPLRENNVTVRNSASAMIAAIALLALLPMSATAGESVLLDAHFDDKAPDQPIGTGGAAVGEPVSVDSQLNAIVRREPGSDDNQELELSVGPIDPALSARFGFLDSAEILDGVVSIRGEVILDGADTFSIANIYVRERVTSASAFANLRLRNSGTLSLSGSGIDEQNWPNQVLLEGRNEIELQFDMDAGRYWLWFNDQQMGPPEGYAHGISTRGIGAVVVGLAGSIFDPRRIRLDSLQVVWMPGDPLFASGFEVPRPD
jgi:hypothetical protein